jgi:hypothetical protein
MPTETALEESKRVLASLTPQNIQEINQQFAEENISKKKLRAKYFQRFRSWLKSPQRFEREVQRLLKVHDKEYMQEAFDRSEQPSPNEEFDHLFEYAFAKKQLPSKKELKRIENRFTSSIGMLGSYVFHRMDGQGVALQIWKSGSLILTF